MMNNLLYEATRLALYERGQQRGVILPQRRILETLMGTLVLQQRCSPSLIAGLRVDKGLHAFARSPEREHDLLLSIAKRPDCALTLAYTPTDEIVGQVTLAPYDPGGRGMANTFEIAVEVSSSWRKQGIAQRLVSLALEMDTLEDQILLAIGLCWHWDTEGLGMPAYSYRKLIAQLFAPHGFMEYPTTDPDISMHPANILLARVGSRVDQQVVGQLMNCLLGEPLL